MHRQVPAYMLRPHDRLAGGIEIVAVEPSRSGPQYVRVCLKHGRGPIWTIYSRERFVPVE